MQIQSTKYLIIWSIIVLQIHMVHAQFPSIRWQTVLGSSEGDYCYDLQKTLDGGFVAAGQCSENDFDVTGNHGHADFWIAKLDSNGALEWQKSLGGTWDETIFSIKQTSDHGYIMAGLSDSDDGDVSGHHGLITNRDEWVVKTDSVGNIEWQRSLGGTLDEWAFDVIETSSHCFVTAGFSNSSDGDVTVNHGETDYWLVKLDATGNIIWQKSYGGTDNEEANAVYQTDDAGFILNGWTSSNDGDVSGFHGNSDFWTVKVDSSGEIEWENCFGGNSFDYGNDIIQTADGNFLAVGSTQSHDGDVTGLHGIYSPDDWIIKLNNMGELIWQKCYGGTKFEVAESVVETSDAGFFITGPTSSPNGDVTGLHGFIYEDYWALKIDSIGDIQWQKAFGGNSIEWAWAGVQVSDSVFTVAGHSESFDGDLTVNHGMQDFWIIEIGQPCNTVYFADMDVDGFGDAAHDSIACNIPAGFVFDSTDCNDENAFINPSMTEICNFIDDNCNGAIDEGLIYQTLFIDVDGDGFGDADHDTTTCNLPAGFVTDSTDCNDLSADINPSVIELCNTIDDNCNDIADEGLVVHTLYLDFDGDGFGDADIDSVTCVTALIGYVSDSTDCDDTNPLIYPGAPEILNGMDDNCNQLVDEGFNEIIESTINKFTVNPNPADNFITINVSEKFSSQTIEIIDALGRTIEIILMNKNEMTVDISKYAAGIYFVEMEDGIQKFVKE